MKRRSRTTTTTTKKQSKNPTSALSPPAAKRSKNWQLEVFNNTSLPEREMILRTFYQWEEEGDTIISERARRQFESELKASLSPHWEHPFRKELFDAHDDMDPKSLMKIKDKTQRQAQVFYLLLQKGCTSRYGNEELQFLIDHFFCSVQDDPNSYLDSLKMVDILADMFKSSTDECKDEFGGTINFWWKRPGNRVRADTKAYGSISLTLDQKVEWIKYYTEQWKHWHSDDRWYSFLLAIAEACFLRQKFIGTNGCSGYNHLHKRD